MHLRPNKSDHGLRDNSGRLSFSLSCIYYSSEEGDSKLQILEEMFVFFSKCCVDNWKSIVSALKTCVTVDKVFYCCIEWKRNVQTCSPALSSCRTRSSRSWAGKWRTPTSSSPSLWRVIVILRSCGKKIKHAHLYRPWTKRGVRVKWVVFKLQFKFVCGATGNFTLLSPWASESLWVSSFTSSASCFARSLESLNSWARFTWGGGEEEKRNMNGQRRRLLSQNTAGSIPLRPQWVQTHRKPFIKPQLTKVYQIICKTITCHQTHWAHLTKIVYFRMNRLQGQI